jgi:hypothetical protein
VSGAGTRQFPKPSGAQTEAAQFGQLGNLKATGADLAAKSLNRSLRLQPAGRTGANPWASKKVGARLAASSQETLSVASCRSLRPAPFGSPNGQ